MPGRRPIFGSLVSSFINLIRDQFFKTVLEPAAPAVRRAKRMKKTKKKTASEAKKK